MLALTYYGALSDTPVTEYLTVMHDGYAGEKARRLLAVLADQSGATLDYSIADIQQHANVLNLAKAPAAIEYKSEGKFFTVMKRTFQ
jgi:DNA repair protein RadD